LKDHQSTPYWFCDVRIAVSLHFASGGYAGEWQEQDTITLRRISIMDSFSLFQSRQPPGLRCLQRAFIGINSKTDIAPELAVICRVRSTSTRGNQWSIDLNAPKFLKDPVAAEIAWVHK
jgi:hypothetical protein